MAADPVLESARSYQPLTRMDLARLREIAAADRANRFARKPRWSGYAGRVIAVALCQGAALHYLDPQNGVKDFDVWTFYSEDARIGPFPARWRTVADFGQSRFGVETADMRRSWLGRRVDLIGRSLDAPLGAEPRGVLREYLEQVATASARALAAKAVVLLEPSELLGRIVWPPLGRRPVRMTLDYNCILELEQGGKDEAAIRALAEAQRAGAAELWIPAVGGSERLPDGSYADNIRRFLDRLGDLGLDKCRMLNPLMRVGSAFIGFGVLSGPELDALERQIHAILFPQISQELGDHLSRAQREGWDEATASARWRNRKCDVDSMWCHIHYGGEAFVTSDKNFHKETKKPRLIALGAGAIVRPAEAAALVAATPMVEEGRSARAAGDTRQGRKALLPRSARHETLEEVGLDEVRKMPS
jgi:hypothetical protein